MRPLSDTISRLAAVRARQAQGIADAPASELAPLEHFGSNPGALAGWSFVPEDLAPAAALVVVLHGCTQTAAGYDHGSGWSQLAERHGFAVLLPEQRRANNANLCFNWFEPRDSRRGTGEPESVRQMIDTMIARHGLDRSRVFITGLSAGGAMTSVMLATYPELFAGGAIIAGLPYGVAANVPEAFDRMRGHGVPDAGALAALVRGASPHRGRWPSVSVWHGTADRTVDVVNGDAVLAQWLAVHGLPAAPSRSGKVDGYPHRVWQDAEGRVAVEDYRITGMGHGTPLATGGDDGCGVSGAFMLEVAISSTRRIAEIWGLLREAEHNRAAPRKTPTARVLEAETARRADPKPGSGVTKVIEDALRAAGLMR